MVELFKIKRTKVEGKNDTKVEKNNQKTSNLTTQTTDDAVKIDTQNLDEGFNLDAIADLDENAKNEQVTEDDKFLIDANGNVYERVDIQETKGENTSNASAVETLKQSLPNSILEKIKSGDFSKEEAEILLQGDKQLKKWISKYYEVLSKEETITKIEANIPTGDNQNNTVTIEKKISTVMLFKREQVLQQR